jgi:hypothetical protein
MCWWWISVVSCLSMCNIPFNAFQEFIEIPHFAVEKSSPQTNIVSILNVILIVCMNVCSLWYHSMHMVNVAITFHNIFQQHITTSINVMLVARIIINRRLTNFKIEIASVRYFNDESYTILTWWLLLRKLLVTSSLNCMRHAISQEQNHIVTLVQWWKIVKSFIMKLNIYMFSIEKNPLKIHCWCFTVGVWE